MPRLPNIKSLKAYETLIMLAKLYELRRNQKRTRSQMEEAKLSKFRSLIAKLNSSSPYYQRYISSHGINPQTCVPGDFPVMTKTELLANFDNIITDRSLTLNKVKNFLETSEDPKELFMDKYQIVHSSGSSGEMGYFVYNRVDWLRGMTQTIRHRPLSRLFALRKYAFYGAAEGHFLGISAILSGFRSHAKNNIIRVYDTNTPIQQTVEALNKFKPSTLGAYTSALVQLAEQQNAGLLKISPQWVEAMGESVTLDDRKYIESAFKCGLYNLYGTTEHQLMGVSGPAEEAMTLYDDDIIYEFEDDYILVTNLLNTTLPLIRYKMSDIIQPMPSDPLSPYIKVGDLIGRGASSAVFINQYGQEDRIGSTALCDSLPGILRVQVCPTSKTSFVFKICLDKHSALDKAQIICDVEIWMRDLLDRKNMGNVMFDILVVDEIPLDRKTRKFRSIDEQYYQTMSKSA